MSDGIRQMPDRTHTSARSIETDRHLRSVLLLALASITIGGTADLIMDKPATWRSFHVIFEALMIAGALVMATTLWLGWWHSAHSATELRQTLAAQRDDRNAWKASAEAALEGLGQAIDAQFRVWRLTPTESEIALLLLKGYGHKEIAAFTHRSDRTVRQHASVVYDKSGLSGRAELSAFFLQGLMLPNRSPNAPTESDDSAAIEE